EDGAEGIVQYLEFPLLQFVPDHGRKAGTHREQLAAYGDFAVEVWYRESSPKVHRIARRMIKDKFKDLPQLFKLSSQLRTTQLENQRPTIAKNQLIAEA